MKTRKMISNSVIAIAFLLMFIGGCSINDELGNIQISGCVMFLLGIAGLVFIANGGMYERKD